MQTTKYDTFDQALAACDPGTVLATFETQDEVDKIFEIVGKYTYNGLRSYFQNKLILLLVYLAIQDDKCYTALWNPSGKDCSNKDSCKSKLAFYPGTDSIDTTYIDDIEGAKDKDYLVFEKDPKVTPSDGDDDACAICMCDENAVGNASFSVLVANDPQN